MKFDIVVITFSCHNPSIAFLTILRSSWICLEYLLYLPNMMFFLYFFILIRLQSEAVNSYMRQDIICTDNGLQPIRHPTIIWTNASLFSIETLGINFNEILIEIHGVPYIRINCIMLSAKWRPFYHGLNALILKQMNKCSCMATHEAHENLGLPVFVQKVGSLTYKFCFIYIADWK